MLSISAVFWSAMAYRPSDSAKGDRQTRKNYALSVNAASHTFPLGFWRYPVHVATLERRRYFASACNGESDRIRSGWYRLQKYRESQNISRCVTLCWLYFPSFTSNPFSEIREMGTEKRELVLRHFSPFESLIVRSPRVQAEKQRDN